MKLYRRQGRKANGERRRPYRRFAFEILPSQLEQLHDIAKEYTRLTGVKCSVGFLMRLCISETLPKWRADLTKAKEGRYHAKIRSQFFGPNQI